MASWAPRKSTFARLLCRLADPDTGSVEVGGHDLRRVSPASRRARIGLIPQDGFLFSTTILENVRYGAPGVTAEEVEQAFSELGLGWWLHTLDEGVETETGVRGEDLSSGERQLVALVRAWLARPGLLVLDEATSAVDSAIDAAFGAALARMADVCTTVFIAHRLTAAETADLVLVFDAGHIVESGTHAELLAREGTYAALHRSWTNGGLSEGATTRQ